MRIAGLLLVLTLPAAAQTVARVEIPITQKLGANGRYFYFVPLAVGAGAPVETLLDSGSTGLMLLPGVAGPGDVEETRTASPYGYGSGTQFHAVIGRGIVTMGGLKSESVTMRIVKSVACSDGRPNCPADGHSIADFGFAEEAQLPGSNRARIGISLGRSDVENPLARMGSGVWIIELPRPGDAAPGKLILNPTADDMAGYTRLHADTQTGQLAGCVVNQTSKLDVCGPVLLDTGGNGLTVEARQRPASFPWTDGTPAILAVADDRGGKLGMAFTVKHVPGDPANLHWAQGNRPQPRLSGNAPFLAYSVLFDSSRHEIGFKPR